MSGQRQMVRITHHFSGKTFNVNLHSGDCLFCKAFNAKKAIARKVAKEISRLYGCPIVDDSDKTGGNHG